METLEPRPPRGDCPELSADAERAAEEMLEATLRAVLDRNAPLIVQAEPTDPPPPVAPPTAAAWLDNRRPAGYRPGLSR
jgi:hypothetical protein